MPVHLRMSKSPQPGRRPPEPWVTGHFRRRIDPAALTGWARPEGRTYSTYSESWFVLRHWGRVGWRKPCSDKA